MQSQSSKKYITINTDNKSHTMTEIEYARWLSLLEGVEFVSKRVDQLKKRSSASEIDWVKPLAFQKYIEERVESMVSDLHELEKQEMSLNS